MLFVAFYIEDTQLVGFYCPPRNSLIVATRLFDAIARELFNIGKNPKMVITQERP